MKFATLFVSVWFALAAGASSAWAVPSDTSLAQKHPGWSFEHARQIPVQSGGRLKPLDEFAREIVLFQTGNRKFEGWDPIDMVFSQLAMPEAWNEYRFILVSRKDVRRQLGLDEERSRYAPRELMSNSVLAQYAMSAGAQSQVSAPIANKAKQDPREAELKRVFDRLGLFRRVVSGEAWTIIPHATEGEAWTSLAENDPRGADVRAGIIGMLKSFQVSDQSAFETSSEAAKQSVVSLIANWSETARRRISVETAYNQLRPFLYAWIFYLIAALVWTLAIALPSKSAWLKRGALALTASGALFHVVGFAMRCYVAGRPPVTNMYESIVWVALGQLFFAAILYKMHRQSIILLVSCVLGTIGLIAADAAPAMMDPGLHPLVPVLRSNYWLTIHVLTITLGYAAFALTLGLANVSLYYFLRPSGEGTQQKIAQMNQFTYRAMQFGVVLLAAGTILGGIWADYSWGRFWGWDPKEVWALIALLCYLIILHGRYAGLVSQFGFAAWSVVGFLSVLMAWYGVNFVLGAGLHSYGFSSGGSVPIAIFVALQLAYVLLVAFIRVGGVKLRSRLPG